MLIVTFYITTWTVKPIEKWNKTLSFVIRPKCRKYWELDVLIYIIENDKIIKLEDKYFDFIEIRFNIREYIFFHRYNSSLHDAIKKFIRKTCGLIKLGVCWWRRLLLLKEKYDNRNYKYEVQKLSLWIRLDEFMIWGALPLIFRERASCLSFQFQWQLIRI